ncbi:MAG: T9SS type A sorting domain-containing protein [Candidatus Kapabacteria bacterium]|nr:T9SS type A sorting domain-containing protein [Candidatus Kapabacteria bacterium]
MNFLHTSAQQRSPIRGIALRPLSGRAVDSASAKAASPSLEALDAMKQDVSLLQRTLRTVLKATRTAARSSAVQAMVFVLILFATANIATAATFFRIGGGTWNSAANWSATSGGAGGAGIPGVNDIAIFDNLTGNVTINIGGITAQVGRVVVQSGVTITLSDGSASVLQLNGIVADNLNAPLIVAPNSTLFVGSNVTVSIAANAGGTPVSARIFGSIAVGSTGLIPFGIVSNAVAQNFSIEDGGALRMSGGTYGSAAGAIQYAQTGARGSLIYDRTDNATQTIPAPGGTAEIPATPLGNLTVRRSVSAVTQMTAGSSYQLAGTLTVENLVSVLSIPANTIVTMAASRMIAGGTITTVDNPAMPIELNYEEIALATPLGATTSDLAFTPPAMVTRLRNRVTSLNLSVSSNMQVFGSATSGIEAADAAAVAGINQGGQITIAAGRTVSVRNNAVSNIGNFTTSRLIVNGTLILSTGSTISNTNTAATGAASGLVIGSGGRIQFWGNAPQITPGAGNTFYTDATSVADYQDAQNPGLMARGTTPQEIPPTMNGSITVNRLGPIAADLDLILLNGPVTQNGNLNLVSGGIGMNGNRMILNGNVTLAAGGYIAGSAAATGSAFVYNNPAATSIRTTNSTLTIFNHFGVTNTGNLSVNGQVQINGSTYVAAYETVANNANGQLLLNNTGNIVASGSLLLRFSGANPAGVGLGQGGHIPATNTAGILGNTGTQIEFQSQEIRSYLRMAPGGQIIGNLYLQPAAMPTAPIDYLVSLLTPLTINNAPAITFSNNAILQIGTGDLTLTNSNIAGVPSPAGNFIDASRGGRLIVQNIGVATYTFPIGANVGAGVASRYLPVTLNNTTAPENYTVSVTTAIVNVPAIPANLLTRSVNAQWTVSKGAAAYNGPLTLQWNLLDEPAAFNTSLTSNSALTSIRRWAGTSYANVLPTTLPVFGPPRTLQATYTGNLSNTPFIVSNALFPIYWVGNNNTDWGTTTNWASSSNGTPGSASPPGINDWAIFDRAVDAPSIATNIPTAIQRLTVMGGASPSFTQGTTLNLAQQMIAGDVSTFFGESLHIATNSTLRLAGTNLNITPTVAGNFERGIVFGTLRLDAPSTFNHTVNVATASMIIASGATLNMAGGTFTKGMTTTLQYGSPDVPLLGSPINPYSPISTTLPPPIVTYTENSALAVSSTPLATNQWGSAAPVAAFGASVVVNRTGANRDFSIIGDVNLNGVNSVTSGRWLFQPNQKVLVGTAPVSQNSTLNVAAGATIIGNNNVGTELWLRGQGQSILRFTGDAAVDRQLGTLLIDNINAQVVLASSRNLSLIGMVGLNVIKANNDFGLYVSPADTLTLADGVTSGLISVAADPGRVLVAGRMAISQTAGAPHAAIAVNRPSGIMIGTTGTLEMQSSGAGAITTTVALPDVPVAYLATTSKLRYSGQGSVSNGVELSQRLGAAGATFGFGGTLEIDKGFAKGAPLPNLNQNMVSLGASVTATGASVNILNGALDLTGGGGQRFTMNAPLNMPTTMGMFRTIAVAATPTDARIEYNNPAAANLHFDASLSNPVFLSALTVTNATMTMAAGTSATFQGVNPLTDGIAGRLLLQGTANLNMSGNTLSFTGNNTVGGFIASAAGTLTGSATSNLAFNSPRQSVVRMAGGAGNQLSTMTVNSATGPITNPLVTLTTSTVVANTLTLNSTSQAPAAGGGSIRLMPGVNFRVNATSAGITALRDNNFIETALGSSLTMPIAAGARRTFLVGTTTTLAPLGSPFLTPLMITNTSGVSDDYTVSAQAIITNQSTTYPQKVNVQWNVGKASGTTVGDRLDFSWDQLHEAGGFIGTNAFTARWNGSGYDNLGNNALGGVSNTTWAAGGTYYSASNAIPVTSYSNTPFVVLNPPVAIIVAADSLSINGSGGFNPITPNGFASPAAGNLTITSGTPFTLRISSFNGLNQRSPVLAATNIQAHLVALPGGTAIFNTTGTGSAATPLVLSPTLPLPGNPISATSANMTFDWLNPGNQASTQATLLFWNGVGGTLTSATLTVTILAPPLRASTIAYTQVQNSSNGTLGFNGGGLGQFNITGGVGIPINFGFFSNSNFLAATTNITTVVASIAVHPDNPGSIFSTTPGGSNGAINPQTVALGATGGFIFPIFNWTNPPVNGGITKALITLSAPGIGSTTVTVVLSTSGTAPAPTRLGYSVNSGDLLAAATGTNGFNGGVFGPGTPITSGQQIRVNFASFVEYGAVIRPTSPTQVQLSIAPDPINPTEVFTMDGTTATAVSQVDGTGSLFPRIFYTANTPGQRAAIVTLTAVSGQTTLLTTTAQVWITTTGSIATRTSFNASIGPRTGHSTTAIGGIGINGGNRNIPSGRPFNIDFGFFNEADVLATGSGQPVQLSIVSVTPATETVTIDGNSSVPLVFGARQSSIQNVVLNWRNPTVAGPISVVVRLTPQNLAPLYGVILSTEATITLSTGASVPVALAFSQISSTGTQGINGNNPNIANGVPFNVDLGLFDAFGVLANSLSNSSVVLTAQAVSGGNTFSVGGNSSGVFVNQAGIRLNGVTVTWTNPTAPTTQVRLVVSTTAGAGPIASTSAIVTISASAVFPAISGFVPATGGPGTTVLISGSNFTGVNGVSFNGAAATTFTVLGDNLISVVVPAGAVTGPVTVSRPPGPGYPGGFGTSTAIFTVGIPPSISSFTPTSGGTGTILTISGSNFGTLMNLFTVNVAGVAGTVQSINAAGTEMTVLISGSSLTQRIGSVTIATAGGVGTSAQLFTYNVAPTISSVTPNSAIVNGQDIPIIIRGSNFNINLNPGSTEVQSGVYFSLSNSPQAISPSSRISVQSVSATEIRATISGTFNNMVGQRFVTVLNADGQLANIPFQLVAGSTPTLTSITPSTTSASGVAFIATINGTNFFGAAGTTVTANGRSLTLLSASSTQLRVLVPADLNQVPQTLTIVVRNSDGQQVQGTITISDPGRPVINSITPARAIVGTSAIVVTIAGSGFFLNADVTFNFLPIQVLSNPPRSTSQITALIPASMLTNFGTFQVRVSNPGGFNAAALFNVGYPSPAITSVLTASGAVSGQNVTAASVFPFQLAITGRGFRQGLTVRFNGAQVPIVSTSDTQVIVQIAAGFNGTPGVFPITLANADGLQAESTFTIGQPNGPRITAVSPSTTNATGTPFVITVNGLNFGVTPQGQPLAGFQIRYNGTVLQILGASPTQVTAFVPAGVNSQEGNAVVQIINPDTQFAQASVNVLCSLCPIISSVTPTDLRPQYNFDVTFTITGSNFQQGATVTVGGVPLRITNIGANQITAVAPAGFFLGDPTIRVVNPDGRSFTLPNAFRPGVREVQTVEVMSGSVYPNPMEDMVSFEANLPKAGQLRVRITDVLGNTVVLFTQAVGAGRFSQQLDVSALNTGVYFFEMTDGERRFTDKLIKR